MYIQYNDQIEAAKAYAEFLSDSNRKYYARAYNFRQPSDSEWWVLPSPKNPAYQYGKFSFWHEIGCLHCGYYVEKGFGKEYKDFVDKSLLLNDDWDWKQFHKALEHGDVDKVLDRFTFPVIITLIGGVMGKTGENRLQFLREKGKLIVIEGNKIQGAFYNLAKSSSMKEVANQLLEKEWGGYWVNFYIHTKFQFSNNGWGTYELHESFLKPFEKWIMK